MTARRLRVARTVFGATDPAACNQCGRKELEPNPFPSHTGPAMYLCPACREGVTLC